MALFRSGVELVSLRLLNFDFRYGRKEEDKAWRRHNQALTSTIGCFGRQIESHAPLLRVVILMISTELAQLLARPARPVRVRRY